MKLRSSNSLTLEQVQGVRANEITNYPSFSKQLGQYRLYLDMPKEFCVAHLPKHNDTVILVDENEKEFSMRYLVHSKIRLGRGWGDFTAAHNLSERDTVCFQLIEPCKFKVHIVRASQCGVNGGTIGSQTFETNKATDTGMMDYQPAKKKVRFMSETEPSTDLNNAEHVIHFEDINGVEDFVVQIDGKILILPKDVRRKYYELCRSQKMFLHEGCHKCLSTNLVVGMISEVVSVAQCTKGARLSTCVHNLEHWSKTVKFLEDFGMSVEFLRDRINRLGEISCLHQDLIESKKIKGARIEEERKVLREKLVEFGEMMKSLEVQKDLVEKLHAEIDPLKAKDEELGILFQKVAGSPF